MNRLVAGHTLALVWVIAMIATGCGSDTPPTQQLVESNDVGPMVALPNGGLLYGERTTGIIWDVDSSGKRGESPVAEVKVSSGSTTTKSSERGLLGLAVDQQQRTFASWIAPNGEMVVGQVAPGPIRIVWVGPLTPDSNIGPIPDTHIGGRLAFTPEHRLLLGIGDLQDRTNLESDTHPNGKLVTLDPERGGDQQANVISKGWTNPTGLAYMTGLLWAVDQGFAAPDKIGRAGDRGFIGAPADIGENADVRGLSPYGDRELVICVGKSRELERFLINDVEALPGRTLARDCTGDVVELSDSRIAYASTNGISVTAK